MTRTTTHLIYLSITFVFGIAFLPKPVLAQCPVSVNAGEDITLCSPPTPVQLQGSISGTYLGFTWSPTTGMTGSNTLSPTINNPTNATYVLTVRAVDPSQNLIVNGGFESGNTDFTTNYTYSPGDLYPEGVYEVLSNPAGSHPDFAGCSAQEGGQMMAVNGNGAINQNVWCQTVSVSPNTQYAFSAWATSLVGASPALLQFSVNGTNLGTVFNVGSSLCNWQQFYALWNSGTTTNANICVVNQNTALSGNDFALDGIGFSPVCVVTDTVKVKVVTVNAVASPFTVQLPCQNATVTLNGSNSSTGPGYEYLWSTPDGNIVSGESTLTPVVNATGTYILTVTYNGNNTSCTKTATVNVIPPAVPLTATILPPATLGCGVNTVTLFGNSSQSNVSYSWSTLDGNIVSNSNLKNIIVNQPGTYTLVITHNTNGCSETASVEVFAATNAPMANATASNNISCTQLTSSLSGTGSTTGSGITYTWTAIAGGSLVSGQSTLNATVNGAGTYVLTVRNTTNNCIATDTVTVSANNIAPAINIPTPSLLNCVLDTVHLSANVIGTGMNYSWQTLNGNIIPPNNTAQITANAPGTYTVIVTNPANGCTATSTAIVQQNTSPPVAAIAPPDSLSCTQNNIQLSANGSSTGNGINYQWSGPGITAGQGTLTPTVNTAGPYQLIVVNTNNQCRDTATITVIADINTISAMANVTDTLDCNVNSLQLNANGSSVGPGFTYQWTTNTGMITANPQSATPTVAAPGLYQLLLTNPGNGCTSTAQVTVIQNITPPSVSIATPDTLSCIVNNVSLQATANGVTWQWSTLNGSIATGAQSASPTVSAPGLYLLTVTQADNGCTATSAVQVIQEAGLPSAMIAAPDTLSCSVLQIPLQASISAPTLQVIWSASGGGQIAPGEQSLTPQIQYPGIYTLQVTDPGTGCTATASVQVVQNLATPSSQAGNDAILTCTLPQTVLGTPGTGVQYHWQALSGILLPNATSAQITVNTPDTYFVRVTDPVSGCFDLDTVVVTAQQMPPAITLNTPPLLTCTNLATSLQVTTPLSSYQYVWSTANGHLSNGMNTATATADATGDYQVIVTNIANGCVDTAWVTVQSNTIPPTLALTSSGTLTCTDTIVTLTASTNGQVMQWSTANGHFTLPPAQGTVATVDAPGVYQLTATQLSNGCTTSASINVGANTALPLADAGAPDTLDCLTASLLLNGNASAGTLIQWSTTNGTLLSGDNTLQPTIGSAGLYTLIVTNPSNGCSATDDVSVINDAGAPTVSIAVPASLTCTQQSVPLNAQIMPTNMPTNILWSTADGQIVSGANTLQPLVNMAGTYNITVTNATNGCTATATQVVSSNLSQPTTSILTPSAITCTEPVSTLISNTVPAGTVLQWSTPNGLLTGPTQGTQATAAAPGVYALQATHPISGCTATAEIIVYMDTVAPAGLIYPTDTLTCTVTELPVQADIQGLPPSEWIANWTTTDGLILSGANGATAVVGQSGHYTLTVTRVSNGCTLALSTYVPQNTELPLAQATALQQISCAQSSVTLSAAGSTQGTYHWTGGSIIVGQNSSEAMVNAPGPYLLTVTHAVSGCTRTAVATVQDNRHYPTAIIAPPLPITCIQPVSTIQATLGAPTPNNYSVIWQSAPGTIVAGANSLTPLVSEPGWYQLTVTDLSNDCTATATVQVAENTTPPIVNAGSDTLLHCNNPEIMLRAISNGLVTYHWTTFGGGHIVQGASTAQPLIDAPGTYTVTATRTDNGCTHTDMVLVSEVLPPSFEYSSIQPDCIEPFGAITLEQITGGAAPLLYSFDGGITFSTDTQKEQLPPGVYTVIVEDRYGCSDEVDISLASPVYPQVVLPLVYSIEQGDSVQLIPQTVPVNMAVQHWQWTADATLHCTQCRSPFAAPITNTSYQVTLTDLNGCTATASTVVEVSKERFVYVPNIFSPSSDDVNNRFYVFGRGIAEVSVLSVFDRWGNLVWEGKSLQANDRSNGWDGTQRSKDVAPGVYVWQAIVKFPDGEKLVLSGDVTVVR